LAGLTVIRFADQKLDDDPGAVAAVVPARLRA
jgi:hypothetical protein